MAFIVNHVCMCCGRTVQTAIASGAATPNICNACNACKELEYKRKRREYFNALDGLTIEERLRKIELYIYRNKHHVDPMNIKY